MKRNKTLEESLADLDDLATDLDAIALIVGDEPGTDRVLARSIRFCALDAEEAKHNIAAALGKDDSK